MSATRARCLECQRVNGARKIGIGYRILFWITIFDCFVDWNLKWRCDCGNLGEWSRWGKKYDVRMENRSSLRQVFCNADGWLFFWLMVRRLLTTKKNKVFEAYFYEKLSKNFFRKSVQKRFPRKIVRKIFSVVFSRRTALEILLFSFSFLGGLLKKKFLVVPPKNLLGKNFFCRFHSKICREKKSVPHFSRKITQRKFFCRLLSENRPQNFFLSFSLENLQKKNVSRFLSRNFRKIFFAELFWKIAKEKLFL